MLLSFCTTCMDRLNHLQYSLPVNIATAQWLYPDVEFVILDYNSQDGLEIWVKENLKEHLLSGLVKYYKSTEPQYFQMSHAKNVAHKLASGEIICNLDADNFLRPEFLTTVLKLFEKNGQIILHGTGGAYGKICLKKDYFLKLGGYNEDFEGWGIDDLDFIRRARVHLNLKEANLWRFDLTIDHGNDERVKKLRCKDLSMMWNHNCAIADEYFKYKQYIVNVGREWGVLPVERVNV